LRPEVENVRKNLTSFIANFRLYAVRIVPMTIHGAHEATFVLTRGRRLARASGLERLPVNVFPFIWNIPFGVTPAFVPSIALPAKITVQLGEPIDWSKLGRRAAADPKLVARCYEEMSERMQSSLAALARERPYPILTRICELRPDLVVRRAAQRWGPPPAARSDPPTRSKRAKRRSRPRRETVTARGRFR
jgi:hypothetical protein